MSKLTRFDRFSLAVAPRWTLKRIRARIAVDTFARHYEAAAGSRRTSNWNRNRGDVNSVVGLALVELRIHTRDLIRNNAWARKAQRTIANNTVGTGIVPKAVHDDPKVAERANALWKKWAGTTECESEGRHTFAGIQSLAMKTIPESGEILIRRRSRRPTDGLTIPLQIQVLEADYLDTAKDAATSLAGGPIVQGVEFDKLGARAAYWLFPTHPGSALPNTTSRRILAEDVIHVCFVERPGQARGISWFGAAIVPLKDFDEFEDAALMKQKIAACFAAFVSDPDGENPRIGAAPASGGVEDPDTIDTLEPGMIVPLTGAKQVTFGTPPAANDDGFTTRNLRRIAAAVGVSYEDMTGDYSQVNFSSARMARLAHWANVRDWQWNMLIPILCDGVWKWAMDAAVLAGLLPEAPSADWTTPPMPMIEPDKEGLAYARLIRTGAMTFSGMVREQGYNPADHWKEYAADKKVLDALGIILDSDAEKTSAAGLAQPTEPLPGAAPPAPAKRAADEEVEIDESEFARLFGSVQ